MNKETIEHRLFPGTKWYDSKAQKSVTVDKIDNQLVYYKEFGLDGSIIPGGYNINKDDFFRQFIPDLDKDCIGSIWEIDTSADEPWRVKIVDILETGEGKGVAFVYLDEPDMTPKKLSLKNFISSYTDIEDIKPENYFRPFQIWEAAIPGCGTLVFFEYRIHYDIILCKQLLDNNKLSEEYIEFKKESFLVSFKPTGKTYEPNAGAAGDVYKLLNYCQAQDHGKQQIEVHDKNYIKMDGEEAHFEGGAIRYTKTGKGRFDLLPADVIDDIMTYAKDMYQDTTMKYSKFDILQFSLASDVYSEFVDTVIGLVVFHYAPGNETIVDDVPYKEATFSQFQMGWYKMLIDLSIHFENGAEKYGVDNWKKGIPVTGGDRGGSFTDSMRRHLTQYCLGLTDEPHQISCIWNCVCAMWTLRHSEDK